MNPRKKLNQKRIRRGKRVSAALYGTPDRPRLSVHRTNRYFYAQIVDDTKGRTIVAASSVVKGGTKGTKTAKSLDAFSVGELLGKQAVAKGVKTVIFDRGAYKFHGRVKSFAEGAKKAGLTL